MEKTPMTPEETERNKELFAYEMTAVRCMLEEEMQRTDNISVPLCEQMDTKSVAVNGVRCSEHTVDETDIQKLTADTKKRNAVFHGSLQKVEALPLKPVSAAKKTVQMKKTPPTTATLTTEVTLPDGKSIRLKEASPKVVTLTTKAAPIAKKSVRLKDASPKVVTLTTKAVPIAKKSVRLKEASPQAVTLTTKAVPIAKKSVQMKSAQPKAITLTTKFTPVKGKTAQWKAPQKIVALDEKNVPTGKSVELKGTPLQAVTLTRKIIPTAGKVVGLKGITFKTVTMNTKAVSAAEKTLQPLDYQYNGKISFSFAPPQPDEIIGEMKVIQQKAQESAQKRNTAIKEIMDMEIPVPDISADIAHILDSMQKEMTGIKST
ncbi:MAG TPA: hypothetical protein DEO95_08120 [Ruminococcaceae bacterium]|nr:hypothetical protein [Oscillospiraceae bacterium]